MSAVTSDPPTDRAAAGDTSDAGVPAGGRRTHCAPPGYRYDRKSALCEPEQLPQYFPAVGRARVREPRPDDRRADGRHRPFRRGHDLVDVEFHLGLDRRRSEHGRSGGRRRHRSRRRDRLCERSALALSQSPSADCDARHGGDPSRMHAALFAGPGRQGHRRLRGFRLWADFRPVLRRPRDAGAVRAGRGLPASDADGQCDLCRGWRCRVARASLAYRSHGP